MESSNFWRDHPWVCGILIIGGICLVQLCICLLCWCKRAGVLSVLPGYGTLRQSLRCQVECYGEGNVHTDIMRLLNISQCEKPGIPLVLFVYKVSRENVDLHNALQWVEDKRGKKREDICAVILLEKSSDTDKKPMEVAHSGMFEVKTAVVTILWEHQLIPFSGSRVKIQAGPSTNRVMDRIKESILGWQSSPAGGDG